MARVHERRAVVAVSFSAIFILAPLETGRDLYVDACASCHGPDATGTAYGPPLTQAGAAAVDFQLRTGRMPLSDPESQAVRKPPAFSPAEIDAVVAYVASLGNGPPVPEVDLEGANVALGQEIFVANCAPCHGATANGGAAGDRAIAPSLFGAAPIEVAEAVIVGPGEMPVFGFDTEERNAVVAYVSYLQETDAPGGADIGGIGPVPEGFVAWAVGMGALIVVCYLIGARIRGRP